MELLRAGARQLGSVTTLCQLWCHDCNSFTLSNIKEVSKVRRPEQSRADNSTLPRMLRVSLARPRYAVLTYLPLVAAERVLRLAQRQGGARRDAASSQLTALRDLRLNQYPHFVSADITALGSLTGELATLADQLLENMA